MAGPLPSFADQRHMTGMERAHGRYERDLAPLGAKRGDRFPKRFELTDGLHGDSGLI
ncbi:hypothetical protein SCH01S_48_01780 [Sphingomonas changbaiensis NBRC 104936]|uniref:Uncharacterized protein n=1 Tax=Sphingomonas changbaiensis NBRC 104936 TaxID=1219043 RepID=A0A0E9MSX1_9SPHN|nr:hypothetical protein SCH01S_48_01780 [Sphingomonas changbaiensis NBRC 104936]